MNFAVGEIAYGRSLDPKTGKEMFFLCYPREVSFEEAKKLVAPEIDLKEWEEEKRTLLHNNLLNRLLKGEIREFAKFKRR